MSTDVRPAVAGWVGIICGALAYDVWLIRRGYEPLTAVARTAAGWAATGVIVGHFAGVLGKVDPFHVVGALATRGTHIP